MSRKQNDTQRRVGKSRPVLGKQGAMKSWVAHNRVCRPLEHVELDGHPLEAEFWAHIEKEFNNEVETSENPT